MIHYVLKNKIPVKADLFTSVSDMDNRVALTEIGNIKISAVFLGVDLSIFGDDDSPPILFETMIFGGKHNEYQDRYSTWDEAEFGHAKAVKKVLKTFDGGRHVVWYLLKQQAVNIKVGLAAIWKMFMGWINK